MNTKIYESYGDIFTISHGQSQIERGFSINTEVTIENL